MSFSANYAGKASEIQDALAQEGGAHDGVAWKPFAEGSGSLGKLVHKFLKDVADLAPGHARVIIEASGHNDPHNVGLNLKVLTVAHPTAPAVPKPGPQAS